MLRRFLFEVTEPHVKENVTKTYTRSTISTLKDSRFEDVTYEKNDIPGGVIC
jgi:hypothetical protein